MSDGVFGPVLILFVVLVYRGVESEARQGRDAEVAADSQRSLGRADARLICPVSAELGDMVVRLNCNVPQVLWDIQLVELTVWY
jgi:hypothetical protein